MWIYITNCYNSKASMTFKDQWMTINTIHEIRLGKVNQWTTSLETNRFNNYILNILIYYQ